MRVNGVPLEKSARATSWWDFVHRDSTKAGEGVQTSADLSAQAVGKESEGGAEEGGGGEEGTTAGGSAAAADGSGTGTPAVEGPGCAAVAPPQATRKRARREGRTAAEGSKRAPLVSPAQRS
jgi:hypothetical protein